MNNQELRHKDTLEFLALFSESQIHVAKLTEETLAEAQRYSLQFIPGGENKDKYRKSLEDTRENLLKNAGLYAQLKNQVIREHTYFFRESSE